MVSPFKILLGLVISIVIFSVFAVDALEMLRLRKAPVVSGEVVERTPSEWYGVKKADFTIRIQGTDTLVHARVQRNLMEKVPDTVRFHYSGDPSREVFLHEYEENPFLVTAVTLAGGIFLGWLWWRARTSSKVRRQLGWEPPVLRR